MAYKREDLNVEALERLMKGAAKKFVSLEEGAALMSLGRNNFREMCLVDAIVLRDSPASRSSIMSFTLIFLAILLASLR